MNQLTRFNPAPKLEQPSKEWAQIETTEQAMHWLDMEDNHISKHIGGIYGRIERYVLQNLDKPTVGRGTHLQYQKRPVCDPSKAWLWKKGSLAHWNQLEVRLQQQLHREPHLRGDLPQLDKLGWHIDQHWHEEAAVTKESYKMLYHDVGPA